MVIEFFGTSSVVSSSVIKSGKRTTDDTMENNGTPMARKMADKTFDSSELLGNCDPVVVMPPMAKFSDLTNVHSSTRTPMHIPNVVHSTISRMTNS